MQEKGKYEILTGSMKTPDEMVEFWADLKTKYPSICAIIDPLRGRVSLILILLSFFNLLFIYFYFYFFKVYFNRKTNSDT